MVGAGTVAVGTDGSTLRIHAHFRYTSKALFMSDDPYLRLANVGRCRILSRLGEGGMGVVYKAHHTDLDLDVAIKFLHPHLVRAVEGTERFLREARLAARLNHPGIVRVFDCGEAEGHSYIV